MEKVVGRELDCIIIRNTQRTSALWANQSEREEKKRKKNKDPTISTCHGNTLYRRNHKRLLFQRRCAPVRDLRTRGTRGKKEVPILFGLRTWSPHCGGRIKDKEERRKTKKVIATGSYRQRKK
jgi:hypothetical protein